MAEDLSISANAAPLRLVLVGFDPIFQAGLRSVLASDPALSIVGSGLGLEALQQYLDATDLPLVVLLDADFLPSQAAQETVIALCRQIQQHPEISLVVMVRPEDTALLDALQQAGIAPIWPKGTDLQPLRNLLYSLSREDIRGNPAPFPTATPRSNLNHPVRPVGQRSPFQNLQRHLRRTSLQSIQSRREQVMGWIDRDSISWWQWLVLTGQLRELNVAQRLVETLWVGSAPEPAAPATEPIPTAPEMPSSDLGLGLLAPTQPTALAPAATFEAIKAAVLDRLVAKLTQPLQNQTETPFEVDILKPSQKQDLFLTVARQFETLLDELRFSQVSRSQLVEQRSQLVLDLWQNTATEFLGKYRMPPQSELSEATSATVVQQILQDAAVVNSMILERIPLVVEAIDHLLFHSPWATDQRLYPAGSSEAILECEAILGNVVIQVANAVMQPFINRFSNVDALRRDFFDRRWLSTREIERFRNSLSWRYRMQQWLVDPVDIFESKYRLVVFGEVGLQYRTLYAPRDTELQALSGVPFVITLALEARDAIAPPLRATVTLIGRGVVYVLTQVIGRSIGLVGRGVLQGVGYKRSEVRSR